MSESVGKALDLILVKIEHIEKKLNVIEARLDDVLRITATHLMSDVAARKDKS